MCKDALTTSNGYYIVELDEPLVLKNVDLLALLSDIVNLPQIRFMSSPREGAITALKIYPKGAFSEREMDDMIKSLVGRHKPRPRAVA